MLCACNGQENTDLAQQALAFRQDVMLNTCSFEAKISADFGDTMCLFTLSCIHTPGNGTQIGRNIWDTLFYENL